MWDLRVSGVQGSRDAVGGGLKGVGAGLVIEANRPVRDSGQKDLVAAEFEHAAVDVEQEGVQGAVADRVEGEGCFCAPGSEEQHGLLAAHGALLEDPVLAAEGGPHDEGTVHPPLEDGGRGEPPQGEGQDQQVSVLQQCEVGTDRVLERVLGDRCWTVPGLVDSWGKS